MTMPRETVEVCCPGCFEVYQDWYRPSVNLDLDDFSDEYLDECSSAKCPRCGHKVYFGNLKIQESNGRGTIGREELCWIPERLGKPLVIPAEVNPYEATHEMRT